MLLILLIRPSLQTPDKANILMQPGEAGRRVQRGPGEEGRALNLGSRSVLFPALLNSSLSQRLGFREEQAWWDFGVRGKVSCF